MTDAPTTRADHAELARLAEAATPGPWYRGHNENGCAQGEMSVWPDAKMIGAIIARCGHQAPWAGWFEQPAKDAAFIAAANPATVLALLSEIAVLRGDLAKTERDYSELRDSYDAVVAKLAIERDHGAKQSTRATQAERQRDEARAALKTIRDEAVRAAEECGRGIPLSIGFAVSTATVAAEALPNQGAE